MKQFGSLSHPLIFNYMEIQITGSLRPSKVLLKCLQVLTNNFDLNCHTYYTKEVISEYIWNTNKSGYIFFLLIDTIPLQFSSMLCELQQLSQESIKIHIIAISDEEQGLETVTKVT